MSQSNDYVDPRTQITHPLEAGQVYDDDRTDREFLLLFLNDDVALLKDEDRHHVERRRQFEKNVGSGRYDLQADAENGATASNTVATLTQLLDQYEDEDGRTADHKASAITEAITLVENNGAPDDKEMIDFDAISGIGSKAAESLRANGFTTKGDVRTADREAIEAVPNMGSGNTGNLLEWVDND